jgi:hypothetical protein
VVVHAQNIRHLARLRWRVIPFGRRSRVEAEPPRGAFCRMVGPNSRLRPLRHRGAVMSPVRIRPAVVLEPAQYELATKIGTERAAAAWALIAPPAQPEDSRGLQTQAWLADLEGAFDHLTRSAIEEALSEIAVASYLGRPWAARATNLLACQVPEPEQRPGDMLVRRIGPQDQAVEVPIVELAHGQTLVVTSVLERWPKLVLLWGSLTRATLVHRAALPDGAYDPIHVPLDYLAPLEKVADVSRGVVLGAEGARRGGCRIANQAVLDASPGGAPC